MTREFVYMPSFEKEWIEAGLTEDDLKDLEIFLCEHPDAGDMIQGTGGLRKLRWSIPGKGKSGGIRTLYVDFASFEQIHMIACFRKSTKESLSDSGKKAIKGVIEKNKDESTITKGLKMSKEKNTYFDKIMTGLNESLEYSKGNLKSIRRKKVTVSPVPHYSAKKIKV